MLGCSLEQNIFGSWLCAVVMSISIKNHSSMQWIFTQVSNNFGLLKYKQEDIDSCSANTSSSEQFLGPFLNFDSSLKKNIESVNKSARTLQNILNTNLFKKPFVVWNTHCSTNNLILQSNNQNQSSILQDNCQLENQSAIGFSKFCEPNYTAEHIDLLNQNMVTSNNIADVSVINEPKIVNELKSQSASSPPHKGKSKQSRLKVKSEINSQIKTRNKKEPSDPDPASFKNDTCFVKPNANRETENSDSNKQKDCAKDAPVQFQEQQKGAELQEIGKILEHVLWKKRSRTNTKQNESSSTKETMTEKTSSEEGSDTGYSSRCSTPPTPSGSDASSDSGINDPSSNSVGDCRDSDRSQSPSDSSVTSQDSYQPPRSRRKYQNHYDHQNQYYNQRHPMNHWNHRGYNQGAHSPHYRPPVYSKKIHEDVPSHHNHQKGGSYYPTHHNNGPRYLMNYHHHNRGYQNHPRGHYQINSQDDVRGFIHVVNQRIERQLSSPAGCFVATRNAPQLRCSMDHTVEATDCPPQLLTGSRWDSLSKQVWSTFIRHQQLDKTFRAKMELKERICKIIWNVLPMCRLFVVGSSLSGFGTNSSDVDMCLMVTPRDLDQRNDAQAVLRLLQRELNNCGFVEKMELITAKVPILKFRDSVTGIDVDLNCNNSVGIRNTHLLNAYSQLDWRVRPLTLVVKLWAQNHSINNAKDMTISSYSLVLMVIHYLQCGTQVPVLPSLHRSYPDKFNSFNHVFRIPVTEKLPLFMSNNGQTIGELFYGFLDYYAHKFTYIENSISVRTGGLIPTEDCRFVRTRKNDIRCWKYLCIEEPFDMTNTARSMYDEEVFNRVKGVFRQSFERLNENLDLNSVFKQSPPPAS